MVIRYDRKSVLARLRKKKRHFSRCKIVIVGWAGGGKSALLLALKDLLGPEFVFFSAGDYMRKRADEIVRQLDLHGMRNPDGKVNMTSFGEWLEKHPEVSVPLDKEIDEQTRLTGLNPCCVIEGRVPHTQVEDAFFVFLDCDIRKRAERRAKDDMRRNNASPDEFKTYYDLTLMEIELRDKADKRRLDAQYPGCVWEKEDFDLVINNDEDDPNAGVKNARLIVGGHDEWLLKVINQLILDSTSLSKTQFTRARAAV